MIKLRACWNSSRQLAEFARRVGGQILEPGAPYKGCLVEIPETYTRTFRDKYGEVCQKTYPTILERRGGQVELAASVCNGELFMEGGASPWSAYPRGRPTDLTAYLVD